MSIWICQLPLYMNWYMICMEVQNRFSMTWWQISVIMGEIMMQRCDPCDWRKDAALMQRRGRFTPHACAASVCHSAIIGGLSLSMICVYNPPHLEASGFHLHSPVCRQSRLTERHAGYPHVSQWACAATAVLPSPSTFFCSPFPCVLFSYVDVSLVLAQLYIPIASHYLLFRTLYPCLLSNDAFIF